MERLLIKNDCLVDDLYIIHAQMNHFDRMLELFLDAAHWLNTLGSSQWRHFLDGYGRDDISASINAGTAFLIMRNDVVIGSFTVQLTPDVWDIHIWGDAHLDDSVFLHRLVLSRSAAGNGLGGTILKWIEHNLEFPPHKKYIKLDCVGDNAKLNHFYVSNEYLFLGAAADGHHKYQKEIKHITLQDNNLRVEMM